jgi:hypothetical protein
MFVRRLRGLAATLLLALLVLSPPASADELADFHAAVERAAGEYRLALRTLETRGQDETAAAVHRLRAAWQAIGERFGANRPAAFVDDDNFTGMFMQIDVGLVGVLLVIDLGNRDGARSALAPIGETLARLSARSAPPPR